MSYLRPAHGFSAACHGSMRPSLSCHSHASVGWYATLLCGIGEGHGVVVLLTKSSHRQHLITHCGVVSSTCVQLLSSMSRQHASIVVTCHSHASVGWYATLLCGIGEGHGVVVLLTKASHRQHLITHCGVVSSTCVQLLSSMSRQHASIVVMS